MAPLARLVKQFDRSSRARLVCRSVHCRGGRHDTGRERCHCCLAGRCIAVRRRAILILPEGVGQHEQMAWTNKSLAQSNKSCTGDEATKRR